MDCVNYAYRKEKPSHFNSCIIECLKFLNNQVCHINAILALKWKRKKKWNFPQIQIMIPLLNDISRENYITQSQFSILILNYPYF